MAEEALQPAPGKKPTKKEAAKLLLEKIEAALEEYKIHFSKKSFGSKLKKAAKLFAGVEKKEKTAKKKDKPAKKISAKKTNKKK